MHIKISISSEKKKNHVLYILEQNQVFHMTKYIVTLSALKYVPMYISHLIF